VYRHSVIQLYLGGIRNVCIYHFVIVKQAQTAVYSFVDGLIIEA